MKKLICILLSVFLLVAFCACTGETDVDSNSTNPPESSSSTSTTEASSAPEKEVKLSDIKEKIIADTKAENPIDVSTDRLTELYGIEAADVVESACFVTSNGTFPEEVIMIKSKDADAQKRIVELLQARIDDVKVQSENYDAENYALAQKCKVTTEGDYVAMFISAQHETMKAIFAGAVK